jgi:IPT/TIG domain/FHA domain
MSSTPPPSSSLTVLGGALNGTCFALEGVATEALIGSGPGCLVQIPLPGVAASHARLHRSAGGFTVEDAQSPRGTFLNDLPVAGPRPMSDGDVLWLGPPGDGESVMLRYRAPSAPQPSADPGDAFFVEDVAPPVPANALPPDEFVVVDDDAAPSALAESPPAGEDVFFVADETAPEPPPHAKPEPGASDFFFVADEGPVAVEASQPPAAPRTAPAPAAPLPGPRNAPPPATRPAAPPAPASAKAIAPTMPAPDIPKPALPPVKPAPPIPAKPAAPPAAAAPPTPRPAPPPMARAVVAPSPPRPARTASRPAAPPASRPAPRRPSPGRGAGPASSSKLPLYAGIGAVALLLVVGGGALLLRLLAKPELRSVSPTRARIGEAVTLTGRNFSSAAANDVVLFGETRAAVQSASSTTIAAEVPDLPVAAGGDSPFPVSVRVGARESQALSISVYRAASIHGLSPDVAMAGEEITLAGSGWTPNAIVRFGTTSAEIVERSPSQIRVKVPALEGAPGTPFPVTIADGMDVSNAAPFLLGHLPLITGLQPGSASAGDVVTLSGRGFHWKASENVVRVDGARALVTAPGSDELKFVVPWTSHAGALPVSLEVADSGSKADATLQVAASSDPVDFEFAVEPVEATPLCNCAAVATPLGPAFVLATSGNRPAADRALEAARRLNEAAIPLKASRDVSFELRNMATKPILALSGRPETILEVTDEDAAAYNQDWTRLGSRGGPVTAARLAVWWRAVAQDLVLLLVRSEKPQYSPGLAPEGRAFVDVFESARKTGRFGVGRDVVEGLRPPTLAALRVIGLRVPAQVQAPAGSAPAPRTDTAAVAAPSATPPLRLEGVWVGYSLEGGVKRYVTATFRDRGGDLTLEGGVAISLPLFAIEQPKKDTVRFGVEYRGGTHYYYGQWDGKKITGRISNDRAGRGETGAFELSRR